MLPKFCHKDSSYIDSSTDFQLYRLMSEGQPVPNVVVNDLLAEAMVQGFESKVKLFYPPLQMMTPTRVGTPKQFCGMLLCMKSCPSLLGLVCAESPTL